MPFFRAFLNVLKKPIALPPLETLKQRTAFLRPLDWLIIGALAITMALAVATMLAGVSLALTSKVPAYGGTYREGMIGSPRFVNPLLAISETDQSLSKLVFSGLLRKRPDGTPLPDLAEGYEISEDELTYTLTIREDARFHDGSPVTADDVVFTVKAAQNPDIKSPRRAEWEGVLVEALDDRTVVFTLNAPYAPFIENLTLGILPKSLWGEVSSEEFPFTTLNEKPVGSGPFRIESRRENSSGIPIEYRLKAWNGVRRPYIDTFIVKFYTNEEALLASLNRGEIDAANSINPGATDGMRTVYEAVFGRIFGVFMNQNQNTLFADSAVRRALNAAVDKQRLVDTVLSGYGSVIDGPLPPDSIRIAPAAGSAEERIQAAKAILEGDGWEAGVDGVYEKTTTVKGKKEVKRLAFSLSTSNADELREASELVAADWRALGAEVSLKIFEQNDLAVEVIRPRKYDALLFGEVVGREPDLFAFWHSSQRNDPGLNIALYANTDTDKKLSDARIETDPAKRKSLSKAAAREISDETAAIFLYAPHFVYVAPKSVSGIIFGDLSTPADRYDTVDQWYMKTEQVWPLFTVDLSQLFKSITNFL